MLLFIDACVRKDSRTKELAESLLAQLNEDTKTVDLSVDGLPVLTAEAIEERTAAVKAGDYSNPVFDPANQFAAADTIVIAAPFWDLSFPAVLKKYIESVCVSGITFRYDENGVPIGLCKAERLFYVTTAGGAIFCPEYGYGYIKALAEGMFGIPECRLYAAENLDIVGNDAQAILDEAKRRIIQDFRTDEKQEDIR